MRYGFFRTTLGPQSLLAPPEAPAPDADAPGGAPAAPLEGHRSVRVAQIVPANGSPGQPFTPAAFTGPLPPAPAGQRAALPAISARA